MFFCLDLVLGFRIFSFGFADSFLFERREGGGILVWARGGVKWPVKIFSVATGLRNFLFWQFFVGVGLSRRPGGLWQFFVGAVVTENYLLSSRG